jgi:serine/threonine protein kinase
MGNTSKQNKTGDAESPPETTREFVIGDSLADDTMARHRDASSETASIKPSSIDQTQNFEFDPEATAAFNSNLTSPGSPNVIRVNIPGYKIISELGRGAMGVVYKAKQEMADRMVALKVMLNQQHANESELSRFKVEAQAAARLEHPNIVHVYEVWPQGDLPYFTLEYIDGGTLARRIRNQMMSQVETARMMKTLADAIAYAHSRGVIHRDLKPANILLTRDGIPKIADFGLARRTDDISHLTIDGTILGTPSYMSPEQAQGEQDKIGPLSDVYTLGAIMYELLTGRTPFRASSAWEVIIQVRSVEPTPLSMLEPKTPQDLETICLKCLQKDPDKRYGSAQLLSDDLRRFLNNEPILARPIGMPERLLRLCKRNPREASLIGVVASVLLIASVAATGAAILLSRKNNTITTQNQQIEKQLNEIVKEKEVSDDRLSLYRTTVAKFVNRTPRLLELEPIAAGTKQEILGLINAVVSESAKNAAVGSSQKWAIMAVELRKGEAAFVEAELSKDQESKDQFYNTAGTCFHNAVQIATDVYESPELDRAIASSNLANVMSRMAQCQFRRDKSTWKELVPIHKRAIELAREAVAEEKPGNNLHSATVDYRSSLGEKLLRYCEFLLEVDKGNTQFQEKVMTWLSEAESLQLSVLASVEDTSSVSEDARKQLAGTYQLLAVLARAQGDDGATRKAYESAISNYQLLTLAGGNRFAFHVNASKCANEYGDYLLEIKAAPGLIEKQYAIGLNAYMSMMQSPEMTYLEQEGLAMQYYRLGLASLRGGNIIQSRQLFRHCAVIREKGYLDALVASTDKAKLANWGEDVAKTTSVAMRQRTELMIAQSRANMKTEVLAHVKEIVSQCNRNALDESNISKDRTLVACAVSLGILSESIRSESPSEADRYFSHAKTVLEQAIEAGYAEIRYVRTDPDFEWLASSPSLLEIEQVFARAEANRLTQQP